MKTLALVLALALAPSAARASSFRFKVPAGWVDLSPGAPPENFKPISPEMLAQVKGQHAAFFAADIAHGEKFLVNVNAIVDHGTSPVTEELLQQIGGELSEGMRKQGAGFEGRMLEHRVIDIHGVICGRYVNELKIGGLPVRQVGYLLPGHDEHAIVTYSASPEQFPQYEKIFDAAAQETAGLAEPESGGSQIFKRAGRGALFGGIAGGVAVLLLGLLRRKKRPPAAS